MKKHASDDKVFRGDSSETQDSVALTNNNAAALLGPIYLDMMERMSIRNPPWNVPEDDGEVERMVVRLSQPVRRK